MVKKGGRITRVTSQGRRRPVATPATRWATVLKPPDQPTTQPPPHHHPLPLLFLRLLLRLFLVFFASSPSRSSTGARDWIWTGDGEKTLWLASHEQAAAAGRAARAAPNTRGRRANVLYYENSSSFSFNIFTFIFLSLLFYLFLVLNSDNKTK